MSMKVSSSDGVKVYHVTSGKTMPQWLEESKKKSLRKDDAYRRYGFAACCCCMHCCTCTCVGPAACRQAGPYVDMQYACTSLAAVTCTHIEGPSCRTRSPSRQNAFNCVAHELVILRTRYMGIGSGFRV